MKQLLTACTVAVIVLFSAWLIDRTDGSIEIYTVNVSDPPPLSVDMNVCGQWSYQRFTSKARMDLANLNGLNFDIVLGQAISLLTKLRHGTQGGGGGLYQ